MLKGILFPPFVHIKIIPPRHPDVLIYCLPVIKLFNERNAAMKHSFVPRVIVLAVFALAGPCAVAADSMTKVYVNDGETYELDVAAA